MQHDTVEDRENGIDPVHGQQNDIGQIAGLQDEFAQRQEQDEGNTDTAYIAGETRDVGADIFARGLCLPSDNKMTPEQQDTIIQTIKECFE